MPGVLAIMLAASAGYGIADYRMRDTCNSLINLCQRSGVMYSNSLEGHRILLHLYAQDTTQLRNIITELELKLKEQQPEGSNQQADFLSKKIKSVLEAKIKHLSDVLANCNDNSLDPKKLSAANATLLNVEVEDLNDIWQEFIKKHPYFAHIEQASLEQFFALREQQILQAESPEQEAFLLKRLDDEMQSTKRQWKELKKRIAARKISQQSSKSSKEEQD